MKKDILGLFPLEFSNKDLLEKLASSLEEIFPVNVQLKEALPMPERAFTPQRKQFNSTIILNELKRRIKGFTKALAVTERDLYAAGLNFVFGEADRVNGICIISLIRLKQSFYELNDDPELFLNRSLKEAAHELGHLYGFSHCPDPHCVMHFSNSLLDTDRKSYNFCNECRKWMLTGTG